MIYLDNAATTLKKPIAVGNKVAEVINSQLYGNPARGSHELSINAFKVVYQARQRIKQLFGLEDSSLVAFMNNATEALNIAIKGLLHPGDHVIATVLDHNSVLRPIYQLQKIGVSHDFVGLDALGSLDYSQFNQLLRPNTKMVVCTHASNVTGELLDINRISKFCQEHNLLFVLDAAQTAGVVPLSIQKSGPDVICFTGHKSLYGPQGTGGICFKKKINIDPLISGGSGIDSFNHQQPKEYPEHLEAGTLNVHGIAGLSEGIKYVLNNGIDKLGHKSLYLATQFIKGISNLSNVQIYGNSQRARVGTVSLNIGNIDSAEISDILANEYNIATRAGAHCAPLVHEALGTIEQGQVRFSFSSFNTLDEVNEAIKAVSEMSHQLKESDSPNE